jgi:peptidoglycan/LPS O-acetylase OafA/YrhL
VVTTRAAFRAELFVAGSSLAPVGEATGGEATGGEATGGRAVGGGSTPRRYLYEVDVVRLLTFVCVIGVHAVTMTMNPDNAIAGAGVTLLHFTRGTFFLLSAYVLCYVHARDGVRVRSFWRRRFLYIGVPYLVWTVVYWWITAGAAPQLGDVRQLGVELLTGTGYYHLYFLLVSLQLCLLFPALLWLVRRTTGHHLALFLASGVLELGMLAVTHWPRWPGAWLTLQANALALSPMYQFYFVAGALAAVHHERLRAWVVSHHRAVLALLAATAVLQVGVYAVQLRVSGSTVQAYDPLQPSVVPWSLAVTLGLYALGCGYAQWRRAGSRLVRFVDYAALASFGVFLVHPLFLDVLLGRWLSYGYSSIDPTLSGVLAWIGALLLSFVFAALVIRTPLALPLTGRRRLRAAYPKGTS